MEAKSCAVPLPIALNVEGRLILIAGGGEVALRKSLVLHAAGARLRIVAPKLLDELARLAEAHRFEVRKRPYSAADLDGVFAAIAATDDDRVNKTIVSDAAGRGVLADFTMPATVRVGEITFAVDTGGASPGFAKRLTEELRSQFGENYAAASRTLRKFRDYVKAALPDKTERTKVLRELAKLPVDELARMETQAAICATRGSALATIQAKWVAAKLAQTGIASTLLTITTTGDRLHDASFASMETENVFVNELEQALRDGRAHYAVHSCKDLPSELSDGMEIVAISQREDPRDVFCSERFETFDALPQKAAVGTSSPRRSAQLLALRPDLTTVQMRGNVDTRLRKLAAGECDAIVIAAAGLHRLGRSPKYCVPFEIDEIVPAAGQGALAVEMACGHDHLRDRLRKSVNDPKAEMEIVCERAALRRLRGGCRAPIGIHARTLEGELRIQGAIASLDGSHVVRAARAAACATLEEAEKLGCDLASALLVSAPLAGKVVVLPRTQERPSRIAEGLRSQGADVFELRPGQTHAATSGLRAADLIIFPSSGSVEAAASYLCGLHERQKLPAIAAMGPSSSAAAHAAGFKPDIVAPEAQIEALLGAVRKYFAEREQSIS